MTDFILETDDLSLERLKKFTIEELRKRRDIRVQDMLNFFEKLGGKIYHPGNGKYYSITNKIVQKRDFLIETLYNFVQSYKTKEIIETESEVELLRKEVDSLKKELEIYKNINIKLIESLSIQTPKVGELSLNGRS